MIKTQIVRELGENSLLLPEAINQALAANDRVKYFFSLLQQAQAQAADREAQHSDLHAERVACLVDDSRLDDVVARSTLTASGELSIPLAAHLKTEVDECLVAMLNALELGGEATYPEMRARYDAIERAAPAFVDDRVPPNAIGIMTRADRAAGDSLHLLVMDLHKILNAMQARVAVESIDGAMVYGLDEADRPRVKAFMRGLNATAPLKFDHPGLGSTATRSGAGVVIQNDIGTTDAHVLVVRAEGLQVNVTYTDIHLRRMKFFQSLFGQWAVEWDNTWSRHSEVLTEGETFYGTLGQYHGRDENDLCAFLEFLGSRLVFLIDWNRARKRLRVLVKNRDAVAVLKHAADNNLGHRAFLELGAEQLVFEAMEKAIQPLRYGQTLHDVLDRDAAIRFLEFVMRCASEGLRERRSVRTVQDEILTDLLTHVTTAEHRYLELLSDHAAITAELANGVRDGVARAQTESANEYLARAARRAKRWERLADEIVLQAREMVARAPGGDDTVGLFHALDEITDQLEDAACLLALVPTVARLGEVEWPLNELAEKVLIGVHRLVSCLECVAQIRRGGPREDMHDFLDGIDQIEAVERDTDALERKITTLLIEAAADAGQLHLFSLLARRLEKAADWTARCAWKLRERVLATA
jgi:uncharacterized protein Yka (UPF0111/DUF47 family)